jgi:hypothetical protein
MRSGRSSTRRFSRTTRFAPLLVVPAVLAVLLPAPALYGDPAAAPFCLAPGLAGPDPYLVQLVPTAHANGARGQVELRFAPSPFGVTVTPQGHHLYDARLSTSGLRPDGSTLVVWAATPSLDQVQKLGALDASGALSGRIAFNKFLVFVTAEASADVERWSGPILLRGISPSGRMHTMAGHGPFQGEPCSKWGFGPGQGG